MNNKKLFTPQFRLRTLCLLVTVVALLCVVIPMWRTSGLINDLTSADASRRDRALTTLVERGVYDRRIIPALIASLEYDDAYEQDYSQAFFDSYAGPIPPDGGNIQTGILSSLGNTAIPDLVEALQNHEDRDVRRFCVVALREIGGLDKATLDAIWQSLEDQHWGVTEQAIFTLVECWPEDDATALVERLGELLYDADTYVQFAVLRSLQEMSERSALSSFALSDVSGYIQEYATQEPYAFWVAVALLAESDPELMVQTTIDADTSARLAILDELRAATELDPPKYVPIFEKLSHSSEPDVRSYSERVLAGLADQQR